MTVRCDNPYDPDAWRARAQDPGKRAALDEARADARLRRLAADAAAAEEVARQWRVGGGPAERAVADERGTPRRAPARTSALALQDGRTAARPPAGQPLTKCRCASLYAQQQCVLGRTTLGIARPFDQAGSAAAAPAEWPLCAPGCA